MNWDELRRAGELVDQGRYKESLPLWTRNEHAERVLLKSLASGMAAEEAVRSISKYTISFWVSALQSAIFNRVLDQRLAEKRLDKVDVGDVAMRHDSRRQFVVHEEIYRDPQFAEDVANFVVSATGPMFGRHMLSPRGKALEEEARAAEFVGCDIEALNKCPYNARGTRRPLRIAVTNIEVDSGVDEEGGYIRMAFDLPRGSYATVVMREFVDGIDSFAESVLE